MSLTIGRLRIRASIPRRLRSLASAVDDAARREFTPALRRVHTAQPPAPAVCRIRQLRVRLRVTPEDVRRARLADLWADAFARTLHAAIAAGGADLVAAENRADWIAQFVRRLLDGDSVEGWAYEEFSGVASLAAGDALVTLFEENAADAPAVLAILDARHQLGRTLGTLSAAQIARILGVLDRGDPPSPRPLAAADLFAAAALLLDAAHASPDLDFRTHGPSSVDARAIRLFAAQRQLGSSELQPYLSAGRLRDALQAIEWLCALRQALHSDASTRAIAEALAQLGRGKPLGMDMRLVLPAALDPALGSTVAASSGGASDAELDVACTLAATLDRVKSAVPSTGVEAARQLAGRWIDSELASVLLLIPIVLRLGWPRRIRASRCWTTHGPRALTYALAGAALAIAGRPPVLADADRGLVLFAGWTGEPDVRGFQRWLETTSVDDRRDLLDSLTADAESTQTAEDWELTFRALAHALVRRFAEDLRGFRRSSDRFIVERFLSTPGRMLIEPARVLVSLHPNPLWAAVHVSGGDAPVDSADWLGGRRVEFELEGL
jgi:hypothetical protein